MSDTPTAEDVELPADAAEHVGNNVAVAGPSALFEHVPGADPDPHPIPTVIAVAGIAEVGLVALRVATPAGIVVYWLAPQSARAVAQNLKRAAVDVETAPRLHTPAGAGRLIVPG